MDALMVSLDEIIVASGDYFDDELTAQLNVIKSWLQEAMTTIRQHELQRLGLVDLISRQMASEARVQAGRKGRQVHHASAG
jgi:hypothetical protein